MNSLIYASTENSKIQEREIEKYWPGMNSLLKHERFTINRYIRCKCKWEQQDKPNKMTEQMPRLIWVFTGCTAHVGFVMQQLKWVAYRIIALEETLQGPPTQTSLLGYTVMYFKINKCPHIILWYVFIVS